MTTMGLKAADGAAPAGDPAPAASSSSGADALASKDMFLRLLVAQIQNQNPLDPSDPLQFISQLAQFSHLEQTLGMRQDLAGIREAITALQATGAAAAAATPAAGGGPEQTGG